MPDALKESGMNSAQKICATNAPFLRPPQIVPVSLKISFCILFLAGCSSIYKGRNTEILTRDATKTFLTHPQFHAAASVAPNLMSDMLTAITKYEAALAAQSK